MSPFLDAARQADHRRRNTLQSALMIAGIGGLMLISAWLMLSWTGVILAFGTVGILVLVSPRVSPDMVMRLYRAAPVDRRHGAQLQHIVEVLADRAELPAHPRLHVIPSTTLNAFATGTPRNAAIAITEGLLRRLSLREVAGVIAHEMSSDIRNNDLSVMGLADTMTRFTQLLSYLAMFLVFVNIPAILMGYETVSWLAILILYLAPTVSSLLQLGLSRAREYDADLEAAGLTGDPVGLASALRSLERYQGRFWEDLMFPVPGRRIPQPSVLRSHPETEDRIARLLDLGKKPMAGTPIAIVDEPMFSLVGVGPAGMTPRHRWPGLWY